MRFMKSVLAYGFIALGIGVIMGYFLTGYTGTDKLPSFSGDEKCVAPCYKYVGELENAYCDSDGRMHIYFEGNEALPKGWYDRGKSPDCRPCEFIKES